MDRRTPAAVVAANVTRVSESRGVAINSLMDAAGVPAVKLIGPADKRPELTWGELQDASGVLSVSPVEFFRGVLSA